MSLTMTAPSSGASKPIDVRRAFDLIRISALRSLKVRYRGSALGVLWSLANPILMTAVYSTIFGTAFASYYGGSVSRYIFSVFVGMVIVTFFLNATSEALMSVVANGSLLNKIAIPPYIFPVSSVGANTFQQAVTTFPILLVLSAFLTHSPLRVAMVLLLLIAVTLLTTGVSLALSALYVFFRDLPYLWSILGFVLWLTSPMFYPAALAPERVRAWFNVNPIAVQMSGMRDAVLGTGSLHSNEVLLALVTGPVVAVLGWGLFRVLRRDFMDLV